MREGWGFYYTLALLLCFLARSVSENSQCRKPGFREEPFSAARFLVTTLVTVRTHKNTHHPAKKRKEAHKRAL